MILKEIVNRLDEFDDETYIFTQMPDPTGESKAILVPFRKIDDERVDLPFEMIYLLEVEIAKDVIKAWSFMRDGRIPSLEEKVQAIIFYAKNDAYLPIE